MFVLFLVEGASASLSSLSSQVSRCQGPCLTPSLANYLRADLIAHVTGWPAEILEKQVFFFIIYFSVFEHNYRFEIFVNSFE